MVLLALAVLLFLVYLAWERHRLGQRLDSIPLRIGVTGTRGKSSVVRMLAAILEADGRKVVAKTTGSQPRIILPGGLERPVVRRGRTSIIEQLSLVRTAAAAHAQCLVAEIMSISPENHHVESRQILQPQILVITNARPDHTHAMGRSAERVASVLALAIPNRAVVFLPATEDRPCFRAAVEDAKGTLVPVDEGGAQPLHPDVPGHSGEVLHHHEQGLGSVLTHSLRRHDAHVRRRISHEDLGKPWRGTRRGPVSDPDDREVVPGGSRDAWAAMATPKRIATERRSFFVFIALNLVKSSRRVNRKKEFVRIVSSMR